MSRWNKNSNRFPQTVMPLDNLLREKENKNSVAIGTVMKWGDCKFTSIRSSCYNMGALSSTSPIQNSGESPNDNELNDNKITVEQIPKPRKFFKSRNSAPPAEIQQQMAMQQQSSYQHQQSYQNHMRQQEHLNQSQLSGVDDDDEEHVPKQSPKKKKAPVKREKVVKAPKPEKPAKPPKPEKIPKPKKEKKVKVKEAPAPISEPASSDEESASPVKRGKSYVEPTRSSGRSRAKCVNYNEDAGEDEFYTRIERRVAPRTSTVTSQPQELVAEATSSAPMEVPLPQQSPSLHPPIVLRISKGTSRLISTDNEDNGKSPACGNSSGDENKNVTNAPALATTDELIAVLSGDATEAENLKQPEPKEKLKIRIKKDYIRSYNDSLKEQEVVPPPPEPIPEPVPTRTTRRRGKQAEATPTRISPLVSEFDSQSSIIGSNCSQNTATTGNTNVETKPVRSRGSSVITSDMDGTSQASLAAAPPSGSENNSSGAPMDASAAEEAPAAKGRRGRKKPTPAKPEMVMKPPEVAPAPTPTKAAGRKTRNTRNAAAPPTPEPMEVDPPVVEAPAARLESPEKPAGRVTRNTRNTAASSASSDVQDKSSTSTNAATPAPRFFTRKRKNQNVEEETPAAPSTDQSDQSSALNLSQKSSVTATTELSSISSDVDRHSLAPTTASSSSAAPSVPEYKHKKLVKRSWEQDKVQQTPAPATEEIAPPEPRATRSPSKQANLNNNHVQKQETPQGAEAPGVKILISKKKGSIFKSRALDKDEDNNKKRQNLYKHKWDADAELMDESIDPTKKPESLSTANSSTIADSYFDGEPSGLTRFTKNQKAESAVSDRTFDDFDDDSPITGLKCDRTAKNYYQVVRNVKKAHQIQEIGEFQEMDDDVEYLLDALSPNIQVATRCLSALQLASKCMTPSFRMHIRAHGIVPKFFKALEDSPNDPSLGLCTAMVMFALSQDTLKMDLDRGSLELMLNLLECEGSQKQCPKDIAMNKQHLERKQKVRELCEEIQSQGKSIHLDLDNITAAQLAMESLLSLTSKRAGEWLKEDLRELGGIEHIIKTVCECCHQITEYVEEWTEPLLQKLNKIERCLRILENVTSNNEENQKYVLHYKSQVFVKALVRFFNLLYNELTLYPSTEKTPKESAGVAIREALVPLLKVILNLTHPFNERAIGSVFFGDQKEIFQISIHTLMFGPSYVPTRLQFDLSVLTLVLLNNLAQSNEKNRLSIMQLSVPAEEFGKDKQPAMKSVVEYFYKCEDKARMIKKMTDEILDNPKDRDAKPKTQDEAVNTVIQNSGSHMEHTILASVTSILIGFVVMDSQNNEQVVRRFLRDGKFTSMIDTLVQYYEFLNLTVSSEASSMAQLKTIKSVIDYLRKCDSE